MGLGEGPPFSVVNVTEPALADGALDGWTAFGGDNQYEAQRSGGHGLSPVPFVRLVDPGLPIPLHATFSAAIKAGRRDLVHELLADLLSGFERLEIIDLGERDFGLAVTRNGLSVPVGLSGDGIQAFVQLALEIAIVPNGLALVEEPEVYQHPKAIHESARALVANVRRGVQVVLTTHSLELIDALLVASGEEGLGSMALFSLKLEQGELTSGRRTGEEIAFARETLETDLR